MALTIGAWCHAAFEKDRHYHFSLLADFEPKGEVARRFGVYRDTDGFAERALFVLDKRGVIRWSYVWTVINEGLTLLMFGINRLQKGFYKSCENAWRTDALSPRSLRTLEFSCKWTRSAANSNIRTVTQVDAGEWDAVHAVQTATNP
jgi:hypothetical protein